ncbi:GNAT family N-acetyltransferase [Agrilactobacillus fermenti]|uniref:GNAT family N-acetyltransferase n=1 Tax=Agrilactobacillus fermenti TaxID=2586909 RepID=UPI003A5BBE5E
MPLKQRQQFFQNHWGNTKMVISSGTYNLDALPGFVLLKDNKIVALITYVNQRFEVEIISLDSVIENQGYGTQLINYLERYVKNQGAKIITLVTTNDNLTALKFYQKRGYRIVAIFPDAVDRARQTKPEIPLKSDAGIPIHDELKLVKTLI